MRHGNRALVLSAFAFALLALPASANVELKKPTTDAYNIYVRLNQERISAALKTDKTFLWFEALPEARRREIERQLQAGQVAIEHIRLDQAGKKIEAPDALIHHWVGAVFIPGAKVSDVLALVQDYDNHANVYKPDVMRAHIIQRQGNDYKVFFRFLKKKVLTVVLNTDHDVKYELAGSHRASSRSWTTRIAEVENAGKPEEKEKPVGNDSGFMWRLDTWWRFEERDGGTYVQCETVSLSRDIPFGLGWLIGPFVKSIPKESLQFTLGTTRATMMTRQAQAAGGSRSFHSN